MNPQFQQTALRQTDIKTSQDAWKRTVDWNRFALGSVQSQAKHRTALFVKGIQLLRASRLLYSAPNTEVSSITHHYGGSREITNKDDDHNDHPSNGKNDDYLKPGVSKRQKVSFAALPPLLPSNDDKEEKISEGSGKTVTSASCFQ